MRAALFLFILLGLAPPAGALDWYARHARPPSGGRVYLCHGYTCAFVTPVSLSPAEIRRIGAPLAAAKDAAAERRGLSAAVQAFEQAVGPRVGTAGDRGRTQVGQGERGQLDCVDEATNTTSLLLVLAGQGYLQHHRVVEPAQRGFFIDFRYPHSTAVIRDKSTGEAWAVDSWPRAHAEPPVIQPLKEWLRARSGDPLPPAL
jgi:hypothetical protein